MIQDISAGFNRKINIRYTKATWNRVDVVVRDKLMKPAFSDPYGFSAANYRWFATNSELTAQLTRWFNVLYLTSDYRSLDTRQITRGLRDLLKLQGGHMLDPDYSGLILGVYRDVVEAALMDFEKVDVLLYVIGRRDPSWTPHSKIPMHSRNSFRFHKHMPWKRAGDRKPTWSIETNMNVLSLSRISLHVM